MSEISEVVAGQVNERFLEVPTNATYFADLAILNGRQPGAQNPFDAVVRETVDLRDGTAWTVWNPTVTSETGTITTLGFVSGRYIRMGRTVTCVFTIDVTTKGTAAGSLFFTTPFEVTTAWYFAGAIGSYREVQNSGGVGTVGLFSPTVVSLRKNDFTTPFVSNGDIFRGIFTFEVA